MLYLGNGVYFDTDDMIVFRMTSDNSRPSVLFKGKTNIDTSVIEEMTGVKVSIS